MGFAGWKSFKKSRTFFYRREVGVAAGQDDVKVARVVHRRHVDEDLRSHDRGPEVLARFAVDRLRFVI